MECNASLKEQCSICRHDRCAMCWKLDRVHDGYLPSLASTRMKAGTWEAWNWEADGEGKNEAKDPNWTSNREHFHRMLKMWDRPNHHLHLQMLHIFTVLSSLTLCLKISSEHFYLIKAHSKERLNTVLCTTQFHFYIDSSQGHIIWGSTQFRVQLSLILHMALSQLIVNMHVDTIWT
jgi:hypothetical protein